MISAGGVHRQGNKIFRRNGKSAEKELPCALRFTPSALSLETL